MGLKKLRRRDERRMPTNRLKDLRTLDDILDEMAVKWALRAEHMKHQHGGLAVKHK